MPPFKVIIVGGGPAGLIAGHCLAKAGIDFLILERRAKHDADAGGSNALWPQNVRVFDQLDLLDEVKKLYTPLNYKLCVLADGTPFHKSDLFAQVEIQHGHPFMFLPRGDLIAMLERRLPERESRLHTDKQVTAIETNDQGVKVVCADGSSFEGSMVIGADGVHSTVRELMDRNLSRVPEEPMVTTYVGVYGSCSPFPKLERGTFYETHGPGFSIQIAAGESRDMFILYHRLPKPTKARHQFSDEEKDALIARYIDTHLTPDYTFKDIREAARWTHMAHIEEGLLEKWYGERIVLLGDAVHKMTPNAGFGFNNGITSAVALTNGLRQLVRGVKLGDEIDTRALTDVFAAYQLERKPLAKKSIEVSALYSRVVAWDNLAWRLSDRYIVPRVDGDVLLLKLLMSPLVANGVLLDFVGEKQFKKGKKAWKYPQQTIAVAGNQAADDETKDTTEQSGR